MSTRSLDLSLPSHGMKSGEITPVNSGDTGARIDYCQFSTYDGIGAQLLQDRLLLSALELYAELAESGHEVMCLKQFFSNPGNFEKSARNEASRLVRSLSQATLDSLDFSPPSEDGDRAGDDRVAILEFELRKARETITALRANLTQQVEQENASSRSETGSGSSQNASKCNSSNSSTVHAPEPMKAYEQRAINFLVHEYLLTQGYRLTSITFADENAEQDFENWDDVGLNMERPADLLSMFRNAHRSRPQPAKMETVETQTEDVCINEEEDLTMLISSNSGEESELGQDLQPCSIKPVKTSPPPPTRETVLDERDVKVRRRRNSDAAKQPRRNSLIFEPQEVLNQIQLQSQHTARALKEDVQQGVEDFCQKFNNLFAKPSQSTAALKQQSPSLPNLMLVKNSDHFSLFK